MSEVREHSGTAVTEPADAPSLPGAQARDLWNGPASVRWNRAVLWMLGAAALLLVALATICRMPANDLWWQLKAGEMILQNRAIPHADVFSFTAAGKPWVVQEWLTDLLLYMLFARVSPEALVVVKAALMALTFMLLLGRCCLRTRQPLVAVGLAVLAAYATRSSFELGAQSIGFVGLAYVLLTLDRWRLGRAPRAVWSVPAALCLWANCDRSVVLGLLLMGIETVCAALEPILDGRAASDRWRTLAAVLGASMVTVLLTPNGLHAYDPLLTLATQPASLAPLGKALSPDFHQTSMRPYELLLIAAISCWGVSTRPRRLADVLLVLGLIYASLYTTLYVPLFALVSAPIIAEHLGSAVAGLEPYTRRWAPRLDVIRLRLIPVAVAVAALLWGVGREWRRIPTGSRFAYCADLAHMPEEAVAYLNAHPSEGNLLNDYDWGGYCLAHLSAGQRVFIDGRADVYREKAFADYVTIANSGDGWGTLLDAWGIDTVLVPPQSGLARALPLIGGWDLAYQDATARVFRRPKR
jgi:hypothetical protein